MVVRVVAKVAEEAVSVSALPPSLPEEFLWEVGARVAIAVAATVEVAANAAAAAAAVAVAPSEVRQTSRLM